MSLWEKGHSTSSYSSFFFSITILSSKWLAPRPSPYNPLACCGQDKNPRRTKADVMRGTSNELAGSAWHTPETDLGHYGLHTALSLKLPLQPMDFTVFCFHWKRVRAEIYQCWDLLWEPTLPHFPNQTPHNIFFFFFCVAFVVWGNAPLTLLWSKWQESVTAWDSH